jgi:hypothetical protein
MIIPPLVVLKWNYVLYLKRSWRVNRKSRQLHGSPIPQEFRGSWGGIVVQGEYKTASFTSRVSGWKLPGG